MLRRATVLCGIIALVLAGSAAKAEPAPSPAGPGAIPVADAEVIPGEYFPRALYCQGNSCGRTGIISRSEQEWYSRQLAAADEIPLVSLARNAEPGTTLLRFSWIPSFSPSVFVLVRKTGDGAYAITAKRLDGRGGYAPGTLAQQIDRRLTQDEAQRLEKIGAQLAGEPSAVNDFGLDGAQWLVEQADQDHYRFMNRWSPQDGPVKKLGTLLLSFTGWDLDPIY